MTVVKDSGARATLPPFGEEHEELRETVRNFVGKEIAPLVTTGPPGVTGFAGGRPKPQEVVAYWPALLAREEIESRVVVHVEEA